MSEEWFDVVDQQDHVVGQATRVECHQNPALIHRSVNIMLLDQQDRWLLQKRTATKDLYPNCWTLSATGHVDQGEDYLTAAKRELKEELGVNVPLVPLEKFLLKSAQETEFNQIYLGRCAGPFAPNPEEVSKLEFLGKSDIVAMFAAAPDLFTPTAAQVINRWHQHEPELESYLTR